MQRITTLLDKIKELNSKPDPSLIEVELMMDYTKVLYADLFEWRNKLGFKEQLIIKDEPSLAELAVAMEENHLPLEETPAITAPAIELDTTSRNYASTPVLNTPPPPPSSQPHYSDTDIRRHIGINDKYQFISELFGNNKEAYEEVISELNTFDTEQEANDWINKNIAPQFGWNPDNESVVSFYNLLQHFFRSR
jgi:hypothetical protein